MDNYVAGVDLGGTRIRACLSDRSGGMVRQSDLLTRAHEGPEAVLSRIRAVVGAVLEGIDRAEMQAIGVASPGPLNPRTGVVLAPPNLPGWANVPLRDILVREFGVPVFVNNDANLAGLAEHRFGAGVGVDDMVYLTISTGIGGGVVCGGALLMGAHGLAGEPGHMAVEPSGPVCNCGNVGCLECMSSGSAIARQATEWISEGQRSILAAQLGAGGALSGEMVGAAAYAGDELALRAVARAAHYLGIGVVSLVHIFDPELVVLGGEVTRLGGLLFDPVRAWLREHGLTAVQRGIPVVPAALGDDGGLLGAVAWAADGLQGQAGSAGEVSVLDHGKGERTQ